MMAPTIDLLRRVIESVDAQYSEARYHGRRSVSVKVVKGEVEEAKSERYSGVGFRVLVEGAWGFTSTSKTSREGLESAMKDAVSMARTSAAAKRNRVAGLAEAGLAVGRFQPPIEGPLEEHGVEEKVQLVVDAERRARGKSSLIVSAGCQYGEMLDHKLIVNSDGVEAEVFDSKPEFVVTAVASRGGEMASAYRSLAVTGGWEDLFKEKRPQEVSDEAAALAMRLVDSSRPKGERTTVVLDPGMVGLISHEAVGHTVEADFVLSGSVAKDRIGSRVASSLVTLVDSGPSHIAPCGAGTVLVDDEGVLAQTTTVIERGVLVSYLHNRETAEVFSVSPTGNARAFEYSDDPIIRMRNTSIEPGDLSFEEIVEDVRHGYLLKGPSGGQADANGEFMFGAQEAYLIEKGEIGDLFREVAISGEAFEILRSVDALSKDFRYDMGAGYCGKIQAAKVDAGGPFLRCRAIVGGLHG